MRFRITLFLLIGLSLIGSVFSQRRNAMYSPDKGSAQRRAIMDALRANVRNVPGLDTAIVFSVGKLNVQDEWAFVVASPQKSDGQPLTKFQERCEFDQDIIALLRKRKGQWKVVNRDVCPSDVSYGNWARRYGAPRAIFELD